MPNLRPNNRNLQLGAGFHPRSRLGGEAHHGFDAVRRERALLPRPELPPLCSARKVAEGGKDAPRPILAIHMETGEITRYPSIKQAEKQGGFQSSAIYRCLRGEAKYHKQHYFRESKAL